MDELTAQRLERLNHLQGTDPGFFVLAAHSFIEASLRERYSMEDLQCSFATLLSQFLEEITSEATEYLKEVPALKQLKFSHIQANEVRHRFRFSSVEEARAATFHLLHFCRLAKLGTEKQLEQLSAYLKAWESTDSYAQLLDEHTRLKELADRLLTSNKQLEQTVLEYQDLREQMRTAYHELGEKERQLRELEAAQEKSQEKIDELRGQTFALKCAVREKQQQLAAQKEVGSYVEALRSFAVCTRTRRQYESQVIRLTAEQRSVLEKLSFEKDSIIRGGAGSGKTLVLMKAYQNCLSQYPQRRCLLVTYTRTLVKYNQYLSNLLSDCQTDHTIMTVDALLLSLLQHFEPASELDGELLKNLLTPFATESIPLWLLEQEIEQFIFRHSISEEEYLESKVVRQGLKRRLGKQQRKAIYAIKHEVLQQMRTLGRYSFTSVAVRLLEHLERERVSSLMFDNLFVDEGQDLGRAALSVLKKLTRKSMMLSCDAQQRLYLKGLPLSQSGIVIGRQSYRLLTNHRNTIPIEQLDQRYCGQRTLPSAFRDGPPPNLIPCKSRKHVLDELVRQLTFYRTVLSYELENICILTPSKQDFPAILQQVKQSGMEINEMLCPSFSFTEEQGIRLSTIHSAKGVEFPLVLLCLTRQPSNLSGYEKAEQDEILKNLVHVGITRSSEQLVVLVNTQDIHPAYEHLMRCFVSEQEPGQTH